MNMHKYFKHLVFRETPYPPIKGRNPITVEAAQHENHYKMTYNEKDQLTRVTYQFGAHAINLRRAGAMDGSIDLAEVTEIKYEGNLEIRHFFDGEGKPSTNRLNVFKMVYEYDDEGNRIALKYYNKDGEPVNNRWGISAYIWKKMEDNKVLEKRKNVSNEFVSMRPDYPFMNVILEYDVRGMLVAMNHVDKEGKLVEDKNGTAIDKPIYDEKFQLVSFKFYDIDGQNTAGSFLGVAGGEIEYDDKGNTIQYTTIDLEGKPNKGSKKCAIIKSKYDQFGNVIEDNFYMEDGKPGIMEIPIAENSAVTKIEFIYNEKNLTLKPESKFHN